MISIQRVLIPLPVIGLAFAIPIELCPEGAAVAHQEQEFIGFHVHDLLSGHELLALLGVRQIAPVGEATILLDGRVANVVEIGEQRAPGM